MHTNLTYNTLTTMEGVFLLSSILFVKAKKASLRFSLLVVVLLAKDFFYVFLRVLFWPNVLRSKIQICFVSKSFFDYLIDVCTIDFTCDELVIQCPTLVLQLAVLLNQDSILKQRLASRLLKIVNISTNSNFFQLFTWAGKTIVYFLDRSGINIGLELSNFGLTNFQVLLVWFDFVQSFLKLTLQCWAWAALKVSSDWRGSSGVVVGGVVGHF